MEIWIVSILSSILVVEGILQFWIRWVNKKFPWLIISKDEKPHLSKEGLEKFFKIGYDPELGWIRKPNTTNVENNENSTSSWNINSKSARVNPSYDLKESKISCYGDSFTFCRQVNDDETWEHVLSKRYNTNVTNLGVGNYGIDQSFLRFKREIQENTSKIVIMGVVPDTISRIMSYWKHYYEYGNTFAFKPKFDLKDGKLILLKNIIDEPIKFPNYLKYIEIIKQDDFFYKEKFCNEKISFPYIISIFKNLNRNLSIIYWITIISLRKKFNKSNKKIEGMPMEKIMKINLKWRLKLFENHYAFDLLKNIIIEYKNCAEKKGIIPIFVLLPQKDDMIFIKNNYNFLDNFNKELQKIDGLYTFDIINSISQEKDLDSLYSDRNDYGGHYSKKGNEFIATVLSKNINNISKLSRILKI
jgi:hypothetical protein